MACLGYHNFHIKKSTYISTKPVTEPSDGHYFKVDEKLDLPQFNHYHYTTHTGFSRQCYLQCIINV